VTKKDLGKNESDVVLLIAPRQRGSLRCDVERRLITFNGLFLCGDLRINHFSRTVSCCSS